MNLWPFIFILLAYFIPTLPMYAQADFCLAPIRPPLGNEEVEAYVNLHKSLENLMATPNNLKLRNRIVAAGSAGTVEIVLYADVSKSTIFPSQTLTVRILLSSEEEKSGTKTAFTMKVDDSLADALNIATDKILESTSYTSGSRAVTFLDGDLFEVDSSLMAGMCYEPPVNTNVGKVINLWLDMAALSITAPKKGEIKPASRHSESEIKNALLELIKNISDRKVSLEARSLIDVPPKYDGPTISIDNFIREWIIEPRANK